MLGFPFFYELLTRTIDIRILEVRVTLILTLVLILTVIVSLILTLT